MTNTTVAPHSQQQRSRPSIPLADAWLPDVNDPRHRPPRKSWSDFSPSQRRAWLLKAGLLMTLAMVLVLHPSSAVRDVVVWSAFLFLLFRKRKVLFSKIPDQLSLAILVYAVIVAASVLYSVHRYSSARDAWRFSVVLAMVFAAWHLFKNSAFLFGFLQLLVGALLIICIFDLITYLSGLGRLWQWGDRWVSGPYNGHPNPASAIIMLLLPISAFLFVVSPNIWLKAMHALFIALGIFLIYLMASRTAQLSLAAMILCAAFLARPAGRKIISVAIAGCLLALASLNLALLNPRFLEDSVSTLSFRQENWRNLATLIAKRPVLGYGYGKRNYRALYRKSFPESRIPFPRSRTPLPESQTHYQHAHSLLLQTAFETGALGLGAIIWLWLAAVLRLLSAYAAHRSRWGTLMAALLVSVIGMSIYSLVEVPDGLLRSLFWLLIAMAGALTAKEEPQKPAAAP